MRYRLGLHFNLYQVKATLVGLVLIGMLVVSAGDLMVAPDLHGSVHRHEDPIGSCPCCYCSLEQIETECTMAETSLDPHQPCQNQAGHEHDHSCKDCANCLCGFHTVQIVADLAVGDLTEDPTCDWTLSTDRVLIDISPIFPIDHPPQNPV